MTTRMDSLMKSMEDRIDDRLDKILTIVEQNQRINDTTRKGKQSEKDPLRGESSRTPMKQVNSINTSKAVC